ncbi:hypothetical protein NPA31_007190 [Aurantimonas sp. MSK8Z-1]|uniref:hypothetical protein n=1 Tax=Mangrovibrevibacter kandeliae TaxID=2968473 RepID=UPI00211966F0|nr:hypothetical protein [Aurantimonas sp. MSK8Z-1]MCW4114746.1 hypothetical protein [Aurantimonas sp. MSK8Z-1]
MPVARYQSVRDVVAAGVDTAFAERVRVMPQRAANQYRAAVADPDRSPFEIEGVLRFGIDVEGDLIGNSRQDASTLLAGSAALLSVDLAGWPQALDVRQGDLVEAVCQEHVPMLTVSSPPRRLSSGRLGFALSLS